MSDRPFISVIHYRSGGRYGYFAVESPAGCSGEMSLDEALYYLAARWFDRKCPAWPPESVSSAVDWRLDVYSDTYWTIRDQQGRFCANLCENEAFGFVAHFMVTGEGLFGGLLTYEQRLDRPYDVRRSPVRALLPHYPHPICCRP